MTFKHSLLLPLASLALGLSAASQSQAAIIVVAPTATTSGSLTITQDITMVVTSPGEARFVALDEWVTADAAFTAGNLGSSVSYSINAAPPITNLGFQMVDNAGSLSAPLTPNDGVIFLSLGVPTTVAAGDTVTLKSATYSIAPQAGFNPMTSQVFTGDVYLGDYFNRMSANTPVGPVPEPGTAALGALAGLALLSRRRR